MYHAGVSGGIAADAAAHGISRFVLLGLQNGK